MRRIAWITVATLVGGLVRHGVWRGLDDLDAKRQTHRAHVDLVDAALRPEA